jgi:hypothetical protein
MDTEKLKSITCWTAKGERGGGTLTQVFSWLRPVRDSKYFDYIQDFFPNLKLAFTNKLVFDKIGGEKNESLRKFQSNTPYNLTTMTASFSPACVHR